MKTMTKSLRFDADLWDRIAVEAPKMGITAAGFVRMAVIELLEAREKKHGGKGNADEIEARRRNRMHRVMWQTDQGPGYSYHSTLEEAQAEARAFPEKHGIHAVVLPPICESK